MTYEIPTDKLTDADVSEAIRSAADTYNEMCKKGEERGLKVIATTMPMKKDSQRPVLLEVLEIYKLEKF